MVPVAWSTRYQPWSSWAKPRLGSLASTWAMIGDRRGPQMTTRLSRFRSTRLGVEPEGAGQLAEPLVGLEAFLGDDRAGLCLVGLQLGAEGDGELAVAEEQALAAGSGGQELADPGAGHAEVVGELGLGHALGDELLDGLPADAGELGDGGLVAGQQLAGLLRLLERVL